MMASAKAFWGAARRKSPVLPRRGADRSSAGAPGALPTIAPSPLAFPHPRPAGPSFAVLGEQRKLIFSCSSPEGFFHYTGRAERSGAACSPGSPACNLWHGFSSGTLCKCNLSASHSYGRKPGGSAAARKAAGAELEGSPLIRAA